MTNANYALAFLRIKVLIILCRYIDTYVTFVNFDQVLEIGDRGLAYPPILSKKSLSKPFTIAIMLAYFLFPNNKKILLARKKRSWHRSIYVPD